MSTPKLTPKGYVRVGRNGLLEHTVVAERALGRKLPRGAVVHHVNEVKSDNRGENLVICPDNAYHKLLHQRMRALAVCGNANFVNCKFCHQYDHQNALRGKGKNRHHKNCINEYQRAKKFEKTGRIVKPRIFREKRV